MGTILFCRNSDEIDKSLKALSEDFVFCHEDLLGILLSSRRFSSRPIGILLRVYILRFGYKRSVCGAHRGEIDPGGIDVDVTIGVRCGHWGRGGRERSKVMFVRTKDLIALVSV